MLGKCKELRARTGVHGCFVGARQEARALHAPGVFHPHSHLGGGVTVLILWERLLRHRS